MVFDGMRPDQVTPEDAPNITRLIANGVLFNNHHAIYPTSTIPNSVAIATGTYPAKNGVPMNSIFIPDFYSRDIGLMESNQTLMEINNYMNGELIRVPTTVQIAQQAGLKTAVIGKKGTVFLHDVKAGGLVISARGHDLEGQETIKDDIFPHKKKIRNKVEIATGWRNAPQNSQTKHVQFFKDAMIKYVLPEKKPDFVVFWVRVPDGVNHKKGFDSEEAKEIIRVIDSSVGELLDYLDTHPEEKARTNIIVTSDHGFSRSTHSEGYPIYRFINTLKESGINVVTASRWQKDSKENDAVIATHAGIFMFIPNHNPEIVRKIATFLQRGVASESSLGLCGVPPRGTYLRVNNLFISPRYDIPGLLTTEDILITKKGEETSVDVMPDIMFAWDYDESTHTQFVGGLSKLNVHGGLGGGNIHAFMAASGPAFKKGFIDTTATGSIDIAPTIVHILGIVPHTDYDGRLLKEALIDGPDTLPQEREVINAGIVTVKGDGVIPDITYEESVTFIRVGETRYLESGRAIRKTLDGKPFRGLAELTNETPLQQCKTRNVPDRIEDEGRNN